jgi:transcriptional regulator of acetoin/glycerol metabolism
MSIAEFAIGTSSSGIAVETGHAAVVVGPEHFSDGAVTMTTVGAPIRHPMSRRIVGSLNLACASAETSPLILPWITELIDAIQQGLLEGSSRGQRALFEAFLTSTQDARHPVICLDENTVITNAPAARLLDTGDSALLWELAARRLRGEAAPRGQLALSTGYTVDVTCEPVVAAGRSVGALMHLVPVRAIPPESRPAAAAADVLPLLDRLPGRSAAWGQFVHEVRRAWAQRSALLIKGETGTGKAAMAAALAESGGRAAVLDAQTIPDRDWVPAVRDQLGGTASTVVLRRVDLLSPAQSAATARLLSAGVPPAVRVVATAQAADDDEVVMSQLMDWPGPSVTVPALRDRLDDLPVLLAALTRRIRDGAEGPHWSAEVVQVLSRIAWPANLHTLDGAVASVLRGFAGPVVLPRNLPAALVASGSRRQLSGLERIEAHAITAALRAAGGNKREAADSLGIARSTLYRKMRALGLNLTSTTF